MALRTKTIDLEAERDRLQEQMADIAQQQADWEETVAESDGDNEAAARRVRQLTQQGNELNNQRNILAWAQDEWGVESVTLAGLTTGEVNRVEDTIEKIPAARERDAWVALGTHEAPYLDHEPRNITQDEYEQTVRAVADLPLPYVRWAEAKISELSHLSEAEGNAYLELVQDKRGATSPTKNG